MAIILIGFFTDVKLPFGIPVGLAALLVGTAIGWIGGYMSAPDVGQACPGHRDRRSRPADFDMLFSRARRPRAAAGHRDTAGRLQLHRGDEQRGERRGRRRQLQPAQRAAGRRRGRRASGRRSARRSRPPSTSAIPGWKAAGGRAGYSLASGVVIAMLCFLGLFGVLDALLPMPAIVPILLYIGLLIGAQAFQAVPRPHAVAVVVAAIMPNIAPWASGQIDNALNAGRHLRGQGRHRTRSTARAWSTTACRRSAAGAMLAGLVLGTIVTFILDKRFVPRRRSAPPGRCWRSSA